MLHSSALITKEQREGFINVNEYAKNKAEMMGRNVKSAAKKGLITDHCANILLQKMQYNPIDWEDLFEHYDQLWSDYAEILKKKEYYFMLDRIEKGYAFLAAQTDTGMIEKANARIKQLAQRLEELA